MKKAKTKPDMMARAMAKAEHEDAMLAGNDPLVADVYVEFPHLRENDAADDVIAFNPFIPEFVLPAPVDCRLRLCEQLDEILEGNVMK